MAIVMCKTAEQMLELTADNDLSYSAQSALRLYSHETPRGSSHSLHRYRWQQISNNMNFHLKLEFGNLKLEFGI